MVRLPDRPDMTLDVYHGRKTTPQQQPPFHRVDDCYADENAIHLKTCNPSIYFCGLTGPSCSKLTTSLVNVSLKFQTLISQIYQYFLLKKCEKLLQCKSFSHFFNKNYQCIW